MEDMSDKKKTYLPYNGLTERVKCFTLIRLGICIVLLWVKVRY